MADRFTVFLFFYLLKSTFNINLYFLQRQTLKNGSATLAVQMADTENNHLSSIMNKKAAITTTTTSAATTMFNKLAVFSTNTTNTLANINRNALGDIGNKIITSNINQLLINKGGKMPVDSTTSQQKQETKIELDDVLVVSDDDDELSAMEVTNDIIDIDEFDAENTQLVSEYVKDIYSYLIQLEVIKTQKKNCFIL
jgi:hypothetical protein